MDKAERAKALRARFKTLFPMAAAPVTAKAPKRRVWTPARPPVADDIFGPAVYGRADTKAEWIARAEEIQRETLPARRLKRESPLTAIAERWSSPTWRQETKRLDLYHAYR